MVSSSQGQKRSGSEKMAARKKNKSSSSFASIFELVKASHAQAAVNAVLRHYKEDKIEGMFQIKMFLLHSSGCSSVSSNDVDTEEGRLIKKFEKLAETECPQMPLYNKTKFCNNFSEFFATLVRKFEENGALFDGFLMEDIAIFINSMSKCKYVGMCLAATLAALKTMAALFQLIFDKDKNLDFIDTTLSVETSKQPCSEHVSHKIRELQNSSQKLKEDIEHISEWLRYFHENVVERMICNEYEVIRSICLKEIGEWLHNYPDMLLNNLQFLRYFKKSITNKCERDVVRFVCFSTLSSLYEEGRELEEYRVILKTFAREIKKVVVALALCYAPKISPQAISLLSKFAKYGGILNAEDFTEIYKLVYLPPPYRDTAKAAGEFVVNRMSSCALEEAEGNNQNDDINMHMLCYLPKFHFNNRSPTSSLALLVDSMCDCNPVLYDWKCMQEMLMNGSSPDMDQLDESELVILIEIMMNSIIIEATGHVSPGELIFNLETKTDMKLKRQKVKLTKEFASNFGNIIRKFSGNLKNVTNLLTCIQYFHLDGYIGQENCLVELLQVIVTMVGMHKDCEVFEECAKAFSVLCNEEHPTFGMTGHLRDKLIVYLKKYCQDQLEAFPFNVELMTNAQNISEFSAAFMRVATFSGYHDMYDERLFNWMIEFASDLENNYNGCIKYTYLACLGMLSVPFMKLSNSNYSQTQIKALRTQLNSFINVGMKLLKQGSYEIRTAAFKGLCKIFTMASKEIANDPESVHLSYLICEPSNLLVSELLRYIKEFIFVELYQGRPNAVRKDVVRKREYLHMFCNLIVKSSITDSTVHAKIFSHYFKFDGIFTDIVDASVYYTSKYHAINCATSVHLCLVAEFKEMHKKTGGMVSGTFEFSELKTLAKQLAIVLKNKRATKMEQEAAIQLHVNGIKFSMSEFNSKRNDQPPYIAYLDVLTLLVKLLTKDGCRKVYLKLQALCNHSDRQWWVPFDLYSKALKGIKRKRDSSSEPSDRLLHSRRQHDSDEDDDVDLSSELTHLRV